MMRVIAVSWLVEFFGKTDNIDCPEWAFFDTDAAPDTEFFRDDSLAFFSYDDRLVTRPYTGTIDDTLGAAFFCMATIFMNNCYSHENQKMVIVTLALQSAGGSRT